MGKTLSANEQAISRILSDDYVFAIPGYQRPYAWGTEQAEELFEDLLSFMRSSGGQVEDMPPYFLGSIVLIKSDQSPNADVVDGQQRLTTLTILLAAIRATVSRDSASEVTQLIYEKGSLILGTKDRFRLTLRERDSAFFQQYIQREDGISQLAELAEELTDSQKNIRDNALLFMRRLEQITELERIHLAQFVVTRCYLVVVSTPDTDSAYRIFSVLNSRGLDLSATDILKSEIIGGIPENQRDVYTRKWEDIEEDLGREPFADLFSHIRMIYRRSKPKGTLIKEFRDHVTEVKHPVKFIDQVLLPMARAFSEITSESYESKISADAVNENLKWLNRLEFTDWMPPAIAFMTSHRQSPERIASFVCDLERLAYALLIRKAGINERIERFSRLTTCILQNLDLNESDSPLQLLLSEQREVSLMLDGAFYSLFSARARTTILLRLDTLLSGGGAQYDYNVITVEHVLPQTPSPLSKWLEWFPDEEVRVRWTPKIGNLALLTRKKNSSASNYEFDRKKQAYFSVNGISPFVLTTQVLSETKWTPEIVQTRQKFLINTLTSHWRLDEKEAIVDDSTYEVVS